MVAKYVTPKASKMFWSSALFMEDTIYVGYL